MQGAGPPDVDRFVDRVAGWASGLRSAVSATPADTISLITLRTMPDLPEWEPSRVTLLGDGPVLHMKGQGAAIGTVDALCSLIEFHLVHPAPWMMQAAWRCLGCVC